MRFERYAQPRGVGLTLEIPPRLESWDAKTSPSQILLGQYLDHIEALTRPKMVALRDAPLSLCLFVGLAPGVDALTGGRDLDNYLFPVLRRLGVSRFVSAWAAKSTGASFIEIDRAVPASLSWPPGWHFASAVTTAASQTTAWKDQVAEQIAAQTPQIAPDGGVEVEICFCASPRRNWSALWKPAIDALACVLGQDNAARPYHPHDDRIVQLGLHRMDDLEIGYGVRVGVWWRSAESGR